MGYCNFEKGFTKRFYPFRELTEKDVYKLINSNNKNIIVNDKEQLEFFGD